MDDPWANAWGEASQSIPVQRRIHDADTLDAPWPPSLTGDAIPTLNDDQETDLALPSWATGATVQWPEPSATASSLWNNSLPTHDWSPSPYESIPIGKLPEYPLVTADQPTDTPSHHEFQSNSRSSSPAEFHSVSSSQHSPILHHPDATADNIDVPEISPPLVVPLAADTAHLSPPGSPDAFGTFEVGTDTAEAGDSAWEAAQAVFPAEPDADPWGSAWNVPEPSVKPATAHDEEDEWEAAKKQKAKQDRHVPPEVLASILHELDGFSGLYWPEPGEPPADSAVETRHELDRLEFLTSASERLIPRDLTLPQCVAFSKTFASKRLGESLRLTRHAPIMLSSPLAFYNNTKGSTTWEASVKSRPEINLDDVLPPGWKMVEKKAEEPLPSNNKPKTGGGLLSFFGRKTASQNEEKPPLTHGRQPSTGTPRASIDNATAPNTSASITPVASSPITAVSTSLSSEASLSLPTSNSSVTAASPVTPTTAQSPTTSETAPSAVSRFLGRFSRAKAPEVANRQTLALSADDLDFLSDIVPTASDDNEDTPQLRQLTSMLESAPLPSKLPPPLAPPPRHPPQRASAPRPTAGVLPPPHSTPSQGANNLFSLYDLPSSQQPLPPPLSSSSQDPFQLFDTPSFPPSSTTMQSTSPFRALSPPPSRPQTPGTVPKRKIQAVMATPAQVSSGTFNFSPPSRSATPATPPILRALSPPPPPSSTPLAPTIPGPSRPSKVAAPLSNVFDDDDFSEFHSSPYPSLPSFGAKSDLSSGGSAALFMTPATSISSHLSSPGDYDDFEDFVSSPAHSVSSPPPPPPAKSPPIFHFPPPVSSPVRTSPPPLPAKSPPRGGTPALPSTPAVGSSTATQQPKAPVRKVSRAAEHARTLSLLEVANSRKGHRWPAPPSPLPEPIAPPVEDSKQKRDGDVNILDFGSDAKGLFADTNGSAHSQEGPKRSSNRAVMGYDGHSSSVSGSAPTRSASPRPISPPQPQTQFSLQGFQPQPATNGSAWSVPIKPAPPSSSGGSGNMPVNGFMKPLSFSSPHMSPQSTGTTTKSTASPFTMPSLTAQKPQVKPSSAFTGGLSAQDLSFFEGL